MIDKREIFIKKAKLIHGDKYDYSKIAIKKAHDKLCIICPEHGEFNVTPNHVITRGDACPYCNESHLERDVNAILEKIRLVIYKTEEV